MNTTMLSLSSFRDGSATIFNLSFRTPSSSPLCSSLANPLKRLCSKLKIYFRSLTACHAATLNGRHNLSSSFVLIHNAWRIIKTHWIRGKKRRRRKDANAAQKAILRGEFVIFIVTLTAPINSAFVRALKWATILIRTNLIYLLLFFLTSRGLILTVEASDRQRWALKSHHHQYARKTN